MSFAVLHEDLLKTQMSFPQVAIKELKKDVISNMYVNIKLQPGW